jgi:hypothetical protein
MKHLLLLAAATALAAGQSYVGRVDTIGGTTCDWQGYGPARRMLVNSPGHGIHAIWTYSADTLNTLLDRNMRYNYCDSSGTWTYADSAGFMQSGVNVFDRRSGYGNIDADTSGVAFISCHAVIGGVVRAWVARDEGPGHGVFDFSDTTHFYNRQWPSISVDGSGTAHVHAISPGSELTYGHVLAGNWPHFNGMLTGSGLTPDLPTQNIAASKASNKVYLVWELPDSVPERAWELSSTDGGTSWDGVYALDPPDAFGGETLMSFHSTSLFPFYDRQDRLHIVANLSPCVNDTVRLVPSQIWHYCPDNVPQWNRIHVAGCNPSNMQGSLDAPYACRPSIGESDSGRLYVAWEQFDSSNVEPLTGRLRAGIWVSGSTDNGSSWTPGVLVTERNTCSHRFPSIVDRMVSGAPSEDTICVLYLMDQVAGSFVQNEGPATPNPVVCQFFTLLPPGVSEAPNARVRTANLMPTVVRGLLVLGAVGSRQNTGYRGELLDAAGRRVAELHAGANDVNGLGTGVYFIREDQAQALRKVIVVR